MKYILSIFMCMAGLCALAQNGMYLSPSVGIGFTNAHVKDYNNIGTAAISHYTAQLAIGYQLRKWRLESGMRYFKTGYKQQAAYLFETNFDPSSGLPFITTYLSTTKTYSHVAVPICIGYELHVSRKFFIVPMAGILASYNIDETTDIKGSGTIPMNKNTFDRIYNRYSIWGDFRLNIEYKATPRLNIAAGLEGEYMMSNLIKTAYSSNTQHNYAASFNIGVKWCLHEVAPDKKG